MLKNTLLVKGLHSFLVKFINVYVSVYFLVNKFVKECVIFVSPTKERK